MLKKILLTLASFVPFGVFAKTVEGDASYYSDSYISCKMANGELYDPRKLTMASYEFPLGTRVVVSYVSARGNNRSVIVKVTDRGPSESLRKKGRKFDLSKAAFRALESPDRGVIRVIAKEVRE